LLAKTFYLYRAFEWVLLRPVKFTAR